MPQKVSVFDFHLIDVKHYTIHYFFVDGVECSLQSQIFNVEAIIKKNLKDDELCP